MKLNLFLFTLSLILFVVLLIGSSAGAPQEALVVLTAVAIASLIIGYIRLITFILKAKSASRASTVEAKRG